MSGQTGSTGSTGSTGDAFDALDDISQFSLEEINIDTGFDREAGHIYRLGANSQLIDYDLINHTRTVLLELTNLTRFVASRRYFLRFLPTGEIYLRLIT